MLHLYVGSKRYSSWSLRPYLALVHAGIPFDCTTILLDREDSKAHILRVNPTGRVPVLHDGDLVIQDSLAICEYVNELCSGKLWPGERVQRAKARAICAEMHSGFSAMRYHLMMDIGGTRPTPTDPEALQDIARVQQIWREALAASGGPFLFGTFSIADAMFAPVTTRFVTYGVPMDATIRNYVDTIAALPGMQQWAADAAAEPVTRPVNKL